MVLRQKLTPEAYLSAPRRSEAVPSPSGGLAFFTVSTHSFAGNGTAKGTTKHALMLLDVETGESWPLPVLSGTMAVAVDLAKVHDITWIPGGKGTGHGELIWLQPAADTPGATAVVVAAASRPGAATTASSLHYSTPYIYVAGVIPGPVKALRLKALPDGSLALAVAGLSENGERLWPGDEADKSSGGSSGRIYDTWQVREWDAYLRPQRYSIWYTTLAWKSNSGSSSQNGGSRSRWTLGGPLHSALRHAPSDLEAPSTAYEPGDAAAAYDISARGILFVARTAAPVDPVLAGCSSVYYVPLSSFASPVECPPVKMAQHPRERGGGGASEPGAMSHELSYPAGHSANPRFSPDGTSFAFLWSPLDCPANVRVRMGHLVSGASFDLMDLQQTNETDTGNSNGNGDGSNSDRDAFFLGPDAFEFSPVGSALILQANSCGRASLFVLPLGHGTRPQPLPLPSGCHGSLQACYPMRRAGRGGAGLGSDMGLSLSDLSLLVSGSSFVESRFYCVVDLEDNYEDYGHGRVAFTSRVVNTSRETVRFGLSHTAQVSEIYVEGGGDDYCVQAWVVRPSDFDATKQYPLALLVHGGPESAWSDEWHSRWNAALWAEQGYIAVLPNITGSVGFGLEHTTRIYGSWGGFPYQDLVKLMAHLATVPHIDSSRAILAGASYGGYMVNWILGNALAKEFKAAVTHDGVFTTALMDLTSDFPDGTATFRGPGFPWSNYDALNRWNPARPDLLSNWKANAPPTLVIHSDRDFRCPLTDGLAVFRTLQFQGVPSRFLNFPDENHFVVRPENALLWHRTIFSWVNQHVGLRGPDQASSNVQHIS